MKLSTHCCLCCVACTFCACFFFFIQLSFAKTIEGIALLRDELDERVTAMRCISNEKKRTEIAAHQIDFFMRRMVQV